MHCGLADLRGDRHHGRRRVIVPWESALRIDDFVFHECEETEFDDLRLGIGRSRDGRLD